jgi:IS30 family transposase
VLSLLEREEISRGLAAGDSMRSIASRLGRPASTVSREVHRNGGDAAIITGPREGRRAGMGERARPPKRCPLAENARLRDVLAKKLQEGWPPQQISGWPERRYPDDEEMRVSAETIYRTLFVQARGVLEKGTPCPSALRADDHASGPVLLYLRPAAWADQGRRFDP